MARLPEKGTRLGVKVHEWNAHLASSVAELGAGVIVVEPPADATSQYDLPDGIAIDLEWVTPRGLLRVAGRSAGRAPQGPGVVVELTGEAEVFQRRDYVRANVGIDILASANNRAFEGSTIDLSGGGLQARV